MIMMTGLARLVVIELLQTYPRKYIAGSISA